MFPKLKNFAPVVLVVSWVAWALPEPGALVAAEPHEYFNSLVRHAAHYKSYSLRDNEQVRKYTGCATCTKWVTYDPAGDSYYGRQDAAKVVVPPFRPDNSALTQAIDADDTTLLLTRLDTTFVKNTQMKVGSEIMTVLTKVDATTITVTRGTFGTRATAHSTGEGVATANNSLLSQTWLPMGTEDGHSYLTTWDVWYGAEMQIATGGITGFKNYQFRREARSPSIWFEVRSNFAQVKNPGELAAVDVRVYGVLGPNVTKDQPLSPQAGQFVVRPERWTRYWMLAEQRANDWDLLSLWIADEDRDPVRLIDRAQLEVATPDLTKNSIHSFQLEFNTSQDRLVVPRGDLVAYVRNVVMLRDASNPTQLMVRPNAGTAVNRPSPPTNVRLVN